MWPCDLSPNNSDFCSSDLLSCAVDEGNLLSEVEAVRRQYEARLARQKPAHLASLMLSTPSIWIKLVFGFVLRLPR